MSRVVLLAGRSELFYSRGRQTNLMATGQIHRGDSIRVSHTEGSPSLMFSRGTEALQGWEGCGPRCRVTPGMAHNA
jgi:hypothetical protein